MNVLLDVAGGVATAGLLTGAYAYAVNWPTSQIFGSTVVTGPDSTGVHSVALTYDDGPSPRNTSALLDVLAEHNVQATFFLIGEHVRKHPALARRVAERGHVIGNHTTMHPNLSRQSGVRVRAEIERCQLTIEDTLGISPVLFRPPYGARTPSVLKTARSMGLRPVMWNVTAHDWDARRSAAVLARIDSAMKRHMKQRVASNVLLHDASHLDGAVPAPRDITIDVTRALLQRDDLRFVTPLEWAGPR